MKEETQNSKGSLIPRESDCIRLFLLISILRKKNKTGKITQLKKEFEK